jgi:hypothetical protein
MGMPRFTDARQPDEVLAAWQWGNWVWGGGTAQPTARAVSPHPQKSHQHLVTGEESIADSNSGPAEGIKGVVEDVKGKAKEAIGTVTGRGDFTEEGKAQQDEGPR